MKWEPRLKVKTLSICLTIIYILLLIPLLWIAWYNYPSADDFSMGVRAYSEFKASGGNPFAAVWGALYMAWYDYFNWMGYYTSTFIMSLPPSVFGEELYFLGAYILIGALSLSYVYLFRVIFVKLLKKDAHIVNCVTMLTLIITTQCLPMGMARVEAFYWYCGAANYILMYSFGIFYIGLVLSAVVDEKKKRIYDIVMACVTGILAGGGNYMTSLCVSMFTVLFIIFVFVKKKDKPLLIPALVNLLAFALSCFAPGNNVRGEAVNGFGPVKTIFISIYYVMDYCLDKWTTWAVLLLLVMAVPFMWKLADKCSLSFKYPIAVLFFGYAFVAANVAPPVFSLGNIEAGRLQALFFVQYILVLVLCEYYVIGWVKRILQRAGDMDSSVLSRNLSGLFAVAAALFVVLAAMNVKPVPDYFTSSSALEDILNGHAAYFRKQNLERKAALLDDSVQDVVLDYYEYEPDLLYYMDITPDALDWTNKSMGRYYGKRSVVRTVKPTN